MRFQTSWAIVVLISLVALETHFHGVVGGLGVQIGVGLDKSHHSKANNGLRYNFYSHKDSFCPRAYDVVRDITQSLVKLNATLPAKLLRLQFHDCFVRGCEGSVLLDAVVGKDPPEKKAGPNFSLGGFEVIDAIKTKLEEVCPGKVSCADILALSARDAVSFQYKKDLWKVPTGRRDGSVSLASEANADLPSPFANFSTLRDEFQAKGLNIVDLVALSGAHTIGRAHCGTFASRLYNFSGKGDADPTLDATYADTLRKQCPNPPVDRTTTVEMDPQDSLDFNSHYYDVVSDRKGLFQSDAALLTDDSAKRDVNFMKNRDVFFNRFAASMLKLGALGVLTGDQGEIRKDCHFVN